MIRVRQLGKTFRSRKREIVAVENLDLTVNAGEIFGLLGPNGAGKTTTVRMICGLIRPSSGEAWVDGISMADRPNEARARIGLVPGEAGELGNLTVRESLDYHGAFYGLDRATVRRRSEPWIARLGLADRAGDRLGTFSKGMRRKVHLVRAMLHEPSVLLLDEPTAGLDPEVCETVWAMLRSLVAELGLSVILCSHHLEEVEQLCGRVGILRRRLLVEGTLAELSGGRRRYRIELADGSVAAAEALRQVAGIQSLAVEGRVLRIRLAGAPEPIIPDAVRAIVAAGAKVMTVAPDGRDLRSLYRSAIAESETEDDA
ncbi:MAG: ABC transporter ATP-binding protein [Tepidisphaerales bacterium]